MHILREVLPRRRVQVVVGEVPADIACAEHRRHVADAAIGDGGLETVIVTDQPVRHEAAVAATGDAYALLVDVAPAQQGIETIHDIDGVLLAPCAAHGQGKFVSVATTAARIGIEDNVPLRDQHLHLVEKAIAILRLRPTVNFEDEGIYSGDASSNSLKSVSLKLVRRRTSSDGAVERT